MQEIYSWRWVEAEVERTVAVWNDCASSSGLGGLCYSVQEQQRREQAYDETLRAVEREVKRSPGTKADRRAMQERITATFARFSAAALGLEREAIALLTEDFLPVGTKLARWARRFDPSLSMADITQACRNAWTACGLQPLLGEPVGITPAILGYSLLYPYSDNYLDGADQSAELKLKFSERFRQRLGGRALLPQDDREAAVWALVQLIEDQYPRMRYPQVFDCLLAIHHAQEESIAQLRSDRVLGDAEVLRTSCAKGGSSVLADACLARGWLNEEESRFSFQWGVLLQLGDDLQDVREDIKRGSATLYSRAVQSGTPLDGPLMQLLRFSERVGERMEELPNGDRMLKELLKMSWRSLIVGAVAESQEFFSPEFVDEVERCSPFRFGFLRSRHEKLRSCQGLYGNLFEAFLEAPENEEDELPSPKLARIAWVEEYATQAQA